MGYEQLQDRESSDLEESLLEKHSYKTSHQRKWTPTLLTCLNITFFLAGSLCFVVSFAMTRKTNSPNETLRRANSYTPVLDDFSFSFKRIKTNSSLFNDPFSIYKSNPSPEVDAAWDEISWPATLHFSAEEIRKLGKDPEVAAKVPEEWGYGKDRYLGVLDGQHLIHCLNLVRKWVHYDYYWEDKWGHMSKAPPIPAAHRSHCLGVLLDALTCQPSINIFTYLWTESQPFPAPDFEIYRQCQNHDQLLEWQAGRKIDEKLVEEADIPRPADAKVQPAPPQMSRLKGWIWNGSYPML